MFTGTTCHCFLYDRRHQHLPSRGGWNPALPGIGACPAYSRRASASLMLPWAAAWINGLGREPWRICPELRGRMGNYQCSGCYAQEQPQFSEGLHARPAKELRCHSPSHHQASAGRDCLGRAAVRWVPRVPCWSMARFCRATRAPGATRTPPLTPARMCTPPITR